MKYRPLLNSLLSTTISILILLYSTDSTKADSIKVGVSTPLTGTTANWGIDVLNGLRFANSELAGNRYELIVEDDKCDAKEAVTIARKFVDLTGVKYVLGMACSGPLMAAAPVYEKAKVVTIAGCTSAAKISDAGDYIFRTWPSDAIGVKTLADYINKKHKRVGVLSEQTEYAQGLLDGLKANKGALEIFSEEFAPGTTDFRTLLLRLKQHDIEAIFLNPQGDSTLLPMLTQINQSGFKGARYAMYYGASETVRNLGGELTNNLEFADVPEPEAIASAEGKKLLEKFKTQYKISFSPMVVFSAIEGLRALDAAIQSGQDPRKFLYTTPFKGTFGQWSFDKNGDITGVNFVMKRIVNGRIETIIN